MKKLSCIAVLLISGLAYAGKKEEAQAKIDAARKASCEQAKANMAKLASTCPEENAEMQKLNCADGNSYPVARPSELAEACRAKDRAARLEQRKAEGKVELAKCKALDAEGKLIVEHTSEGGPRYCNEEVAAKAAELKCKPGESFLSIQVVLEGPGKQQPKKRVAVCKTKK